MEIKEEVHDVLWRQEVRRQEAPEEVTEVALPPPTLRPTTYRNRAGRHFFLQTTLNKRIQHMERIERGWAGHFCCGPDCNWHRNTLIKNDDGRMIVVSSVGALPLRNQFGNRKGWNSIGAFRWYETMAFVAKVDGDYIEADVHKQIYTYDGKWQIDREPDGKTDLEAEKIHEDFVAFVMEHFDKCYKDGEEYGRDR